LLLLVSHNEYEWKSLASLRQAIRQEAKAIADQPEDIKGQLLDVSSKRKRGA
jgi:hypothetical protein